jgi:hypothetical protein
MAAAWPGLRADALRRPCSLSRPGGGLSFLPSRTGGAGESTPAKNARGWRAEKTRQNNASSLLGTMQRLSARHGDVLSMTGRPSIATTQRRRGPLSASSWRGVLLPPAKQFAFAQTAYTCLRVLRHRPGAWEKRSSPARGRRILAPPSRRLMTAPSLSRTGRIMGLARNRIKRRIGIFYACSLDQPTGPREARPDGEIRGSAYACESRVSLRSPGLQVFFSLPPHPNSGLPELGISNCRSRKHPTSGSRGDPPLSGEG